MEEKEDYTQPLAEVAALGVVLAVLQSLSGDGSFGDWGTQDGILIDNSDELDF